MSILSLMTHSIHRVSGWFQDAVFRNLLKNTGWLLSGKIIVIGVSLLVTVIETHALEVELFGLLSVIVAYTALIERLTTFQPWLALIKYGTEALEHAHYDKFMSQVKLGVLLDIVGAITGTVIAATGAYIFANWQGWSQDISYIIAIFSVSILFHVAGTPTGVLRLLDRFDQIAAQSVVTSILTLIGSLVAYKMEGGIFGFLLAMLFSSALSSLLLWMMAYFALRKRGLMQHWRAPIKDWKPFIRFSMWTYTTSTLDIPVKQLDVIIVSAVISLEAAGIYKIVKQVTLVLGLLSDQIYQVVYPQFAIMITNRDPEKAWRYVLKIGVMIGAAVSPIAFFLSVTSGWWIEGVFGKSFTAGWLPMTAFLTFATLQLTCIGIHPLFTALGFVKENVPILLTANAAYLGLAWFLGHRLGILGMAIASTVQLAIVVLLKHQRLHRYLKLYDKQLHSEKEQG